MADPVTHHFSNHPSASKTAKKSQHHSPSSFPTPFSCPYCDRKFFNCQALGGHQNAHRLERTVAKKNYLAQHRRLQSPVMKPEPLHFYCREPMKVFHFQVPTNVPIAFHGASTSQVFSPPGSDAVEDAPLDLELHL